MPCDEGCRTAVFGKTERTVGWEGNGDPVMTGLVRHCIRGNPQRTDRPCLPPLTHSFTLDFVVCFQYREDALRVQEALRKRLGKYGLALEPSKTKLVEFGRFAHRHAPKRGRKRPETIYFLGFTLYCTRNRKGNFKVGMRTEKSRLQRSMSHLRDLMRRMRHLPLREQVINLNRVLHGHYAYYGIAGNFRALQKVHRFVERYWHKMLSSRSRKGCVPWEVFHRIKTRFPLQRPKLYLPYPELQAIAVL